MKFAGKKKHGYNGWCQSYSAMVGARATMVGSNPAGTVPSARSLVCRWLMARKLYTNQLGVDRCSGWYYTAANIPMGG